MKKKKEKTVTEEKIDYPRLPIENATKITEKVSNNFGGIISYKELSKMGGAGGKTQGGTFGSLTKSLKMYGLMERYGLKEMKVTEEGKRFSETVGEDQKKLLLFSLYKKIPIISELYNRYGENIPKNIKSISDFLTNVKKLEKREAGRLANLYIKNQSYFEGIKGNFSESEKEEGQVEDICNRTAREGETKNLCKISFILGKISPKGKDDGTLFNALAKLASENEFKSVEAFSEAIKYIPEDKKSEMFHKIKKAFEDDSGINLDIENNK